MVIQIGLAAPPPTFLEYMLPDLTTLGGVGGGIQGGVGGEGQTEGPRSGWKPGPLARRKKDTFKFSL